jgi:hypothetical protein
VALAGVGAVASAPQALADGCSSAVVWGNGGGQCDGPYYPDGSFQRCVTVYVFGIGGSNCFTVPAPGPAPVAATAPPPPAPTQLA